MCSVYECAWIKYVVEVQKSAALVQSFYHVIKLFVYRICLYLFNHIMSSFFSFHCLLTWLQTSLCHPHHRLSFSIDSSLLQDNVAFVLCLDTLGNGDSLHLHVSKPPKEGTPQYFLLKELEMVRIRNSNWCQNWFYSCFESNSLCFYSFTLFFTVKLTTYVRL